MTLIAVAAALSIVSIVSMAVAIPCFLVAMFDTFSRGNSGADMACHWLVVTFYFSGLAAVICWIIVGLMKVFG